MIHADPRKPRRYVNRTLSLSAFSTSSGERKYYSAGDLCQQLGPIFFTLPTAFDTDRLTNTSSFAGFISAAAGHR